MNLNIIPPKPSAKKIELNETAEALLQKIESQIANIKDETIQKAKTIAIITGSTIAVYWLVNALLEDDDDKKSKKTKTLPLVQSLDPAPVALAKNQEDSAIFTAIKGALLTLLLGIAKEKLTEVLLNLNKTNAAE